MLYKLLIIRALKPLLSPSVRSKLKTIKRRCRNYLNFPHKNKTTIEQLKEQLIRLGITKGDNIVVTSSFGNLNASFSPTELIIMLQELVTENGLIVMPFYPKLNSYEWAKNQMLFDMENTVSGMGILTNVFSKLPNVYKSIHPTKAVCAWGRKAIELTTGHENSTTPFYWDSPYGKLLKMNSKSVCIGVKNMPMFHAFEDIYSQMYNAYYQSNKVSLRVKLPNRLIEVNTFVHDPKIIGHTIFSTDYIQINCPEAMKCVPFGYDNIRVIDHELLKKCIKILFKENITRIIK